MEQTKNKGDLISYKFKSPGVIILFVAMAYIMVAMLSLLTIIPSGNISPLYPSDGVALASILIFRRLAVIGVILDSLKEKIITTRSMGGNYK